MNATCPALCMSVALFVSAAAGCGSRTGIAEESTSDQIALGASLFAASCAKCHGALGQGTSKAPPLVGPNALPLNPPPGARLRTGQFHTAKDVLDFIRVNMPLDKPGSLHEEEYEAILAFDLHANGVDLRGVQVTAANAASFVLH